MQVVILAAGRGTRMGDLTNSTPKPLLIAQNKTLLEYKFEALPASIDHIVLVIGYHGQKIKDYFRNTYNNKHISYIWQQELNGTAGALHAAKEVLRDTFIVMMGDDIYAREDIEACLAFPWALSAKKIQNEQRGGELILHQNGTLAGIKEEKHFVKNGYINSGLYVLRKSFLHEPMVAIEGSCEYGLPHTLVNIAQKEPVHVHISPYPWIQISNQQDLERYSDLQ